MRTYEQGMILMLQVKDHNSRSRKVKNNNGFHNLVTNHNMNVLRWLKCYYQFEIIRYIYISNSTTIYKEAINELIYDGKLIITKPDQSTRIVPLSKNE